MSFFSLSNIAAVALDNNGYQLTTSISSAAWMDYSIEVTYGSVFAVQVLDSNNLISVYVRYSELLDLTSYSNLLKRTTKGSIHVTDEIQYGTYYISIRVRTSRKGGKKHYLRTSFSDSRDLLTLMLLGLPSLEANVYRRYASVHPMIANLVSITSVI